MTWTKQPPIPGKIVGCSCCGPNKGVYALESRFGVGFGSSGVTRDGESVWQETGREEWDELPPLQRFEDMAAADPDHDWRMFRFAPLREAEYQRHEPGKWVLIKEGQGFA